MKTHPQTGPEAPIVHVVRLSHPPFASAHVARAARQPVAGFAGSISGVPSGSESGHVPQENPPTVFWQEAAGWHLPPTAHSSMSWQETPLPAEREVGVGDGDKRVGGDKRDSQRQLSAFSREFKRLRGRGK